jgi:hypothetical protein
MMVRTIILFTLLLVFGGCASPHHEPQANTGAAVTSISVPAELKPLVEVARARHLQSKYATDYPILRQASATEVRFGKATGRGIIGVSYYFDASGHYVNSTRWRCDGY